MSLRDAIAAARARGMRAVPHPEDDRLVRVSCPVCGWPGDEPDTDAAAYAEAPHGCAACAIRARQAAGDDHDFWPGFRPKGA